MRLGKIDFPEPLLNSLRDKTLVVFAGAGFLWAHQPTSPTSRNLRRR